MKFTYEGYGDLIDSLKNNGYGFADYENYRQFEKCVILRHDVDYDLQRVIKMAELEHEKNVSATYFVLLTSDFYNLASKESEEVLKYLKKIGHNIGLHFDEKRYDISPEEWKKENIAELIKKEVRVLEAITDNRIKSVSMHRPSKKTLRSNLCLPGIANSYGEEFFKQFKYLSDSRMRWREDAEAIIESGEFPRIQLLTHAFWYFDKERQMKDIIEDFIYGRDEIARHRYKVLGDNITDLGDIVEFNQ
ncbi:MAG: hypothetical protein UC708_02265 [Anaerovoracaceae bacterium]|nr:hypothetical protein [Bacillota bacterium]MEE0516684.1 hypothetical protein [Anaerovoracaceae bacterium]